MTIPDAIEAEIRAIEADYDHRPGQHAGPSRLRGLRAAIEADLAALRQRHAEAVEAAFREGWLERGLLPDCGMPPLHSCNAAWLASDARKGVARDDG